MSNCMSPELEKSVSSSSNSGDDLVSDSGDGLNSPCCPLCNTAKLDDDDG